jgi:hypothetical protein
MTEIVGIQRHIWAWLIAAVFAALAIIISFVQIRQHFRFNTSKVSKYEIRVLFMVPVYAAAAWLGLYQKRFTLYWDVGRECYEALVIYSFYQFLEVYLLGWDNLGEILSKKSEHVGHHVFPFNLCLRPYNVANGEFRYKTRVGILQYVPIKLCTAISTFILQLTNRYDDGEFNPEVGYPWIALINNCSQIWAMYCLVMFYHALRADLAPIKPIAKFLSIKLVVFFTFWQSVLIAFFVKVKYLHATETYTHEQVAAGLQDFIICIEMFIASVAHIYIFSWEEFHDKEKLSEGIHLARLGSVVSPRDLVNDTYVHMVQPVGKRFRRKNDVPGLLTEDGRPVIVANGVLVVEPVESPATVTSPTSPATAISSESTTELGREIVIDVPLLPQGERLS